MYEVSIESSFSSAHRLRGYKGKCESLHGHNWKTRIIASKQALDKIGLAFDFRDLKISLGKVLKCLDHKYLNETPYFKKVNPTSENIARYIHDKLLKDKKLEGINSLKVIVWESEKNYASYYE